MSMSLDNLGWFYRGVVSQQSPSGSEPIDRFIYLSLSFLTFLGSFVLAKWLVSFARFILSVFVVPGKNVSNSIIR